MRIDEIAEFVLANNQSIEFGETSAWDETLFTATWAKSKPFEKA